MPMFSLVIPTLRRPDTLRHSLATLLRQPQAGVEIIVQNNGADSDTQRVVEEAADERVRHFATDSVVAMCENWERALDHCRGEWIIFIGDDDGLLPDACATMSALRDVDRYDIVSWTPFLYFWPQYYDERRRNRIEAEIDSRFQLRRVASRPLLERFYSFVEHYSRLPMIYNSFVRRSLIERIRERYGKYFFGSLPDVTSGIVNAAVCDVFVRSTRPLSISGVSRHSTGHNTWSRTDREIDRTEFERDFPLLAHDDHGFPSWNFELALASERELLRHEVLGGDERLALDRRKLIRHVADAINHRPDQYEQTVAAIESMLRAYGIPRDEISIPPRLDRPPVVPVGRYELGPHKTRLIVDGDEAGIATIEDAAQFAAGLLPDAEQAVWEHEPSALPRVSTEPLSFAAEAEGERALVDGWSESEPWGTWSIGEESRLRFALGQPDGGGRRLALRYRVIAGADIDPLVVECAADGEPLARWSFGADNHQGQLTIELPPSRAKPDGVIELTFTTVNPRSPAELGLGPDDRRLGIGVEELRVVG